MKNLIIRTLSGAVYVALIVCAILLNDFIFAAVFAVLSALTTYEFHKLTNKQENVNVNPILPAVASVSIFGIFFMHLNHDLGGKIIHIIEISFFGIVFLFYFYTLISEIFRKKSNPVNNLAYSFLSQIYIAFPFAVMIVIFKLNPLFLLALFVIIWVNDSFAYLTGSAFGKHKMFERISPKKSWEGFFGGLIGALVTVYFLHKFLPERFFDGYTLELWQWLIFALIIVVFGTLGDFFESLIKRTVGVKDSGNIMPGHGGFLDRLDSVIFAALPALIFLICCF